MVTKIPDDLLARFSEFVAEAMGLDFPPARWPDLQRGIAAAASMLGFAEPVAYARQLMSKPLTKNQLEALASHLTVGETYFFRENRSFEILAEHVLPKLIRARQGGERRLRIWSAACCTGEEPYSIAILLRRIIPDCDDWNVTLLATDINPQFLRKAEAGVFGRWSFRDPPAWLTGQYFQMTSDGQYEVLPEIKRMVHFAQLNLAEDIYPSLANDTNAMDVIFCRNVLMYFTAARAAKVIENLYRAQVEDGWLIVSPTESPHVPASPYSRVSFHGAMLYQKDGGKLRSAAADATPLPIGQSREEAVAQPEPPIPVFISRISASGIATEDLYAEADSLHEQGHYAEAAAKLRESLFRRPREPAPLRLLARSLANQGALTEALDCCDQLIAADKLSSSAHYLRAVILQEQGRIKEASGSLLRAIYLDPNFALAHFALGTIARHQGHIREADKHLTNTLQSLRGYRPDEILPESEGITVGRFIEIVSSLMNVETTA